MHSTVPLGGIRALLDTAARAMSVVGGRALNALAVLSLTAHGTGAAELPPIRGLREPGFWETNGIWVLPLAVVLLTAAGLGLWWLVFRRPAPPPPTPLEKALAALEHARKLKDHADARIFSAAVSDVLRRYLEEASGLRAPEQTTEEFLNAASGHPQLRGDALNSLAAFLELCDLAKFARRDLDGAQRDTLLATAENFLRDQAANDRGQASNEAASQVTTTALP